MSRRGFTRIDVLVVVVVLCVLMMCMGFFLPIDVIGNLLVGWAFFLVRTVPEVSVSWDGLATAVVCLVGFALGLHLFLRWLAGAIPEQVEGDEPGPFPTAWKARWTAMVVGLVVLLFASGIAATGVAHQTGWLLNGSVIEEYGGREVMRRVQSSNNLKQIGLGLHTYLAEHGTFPPGGTFDATGRGLRGWPVELLPYIEQEALYNAINFDLPWDDPRNATVFQTELQVYLNPGYPDEDDRVGPDGYALSHYAGNAWLIGGARPRSIEAIPDGTSNTLMGGEVPARFRPWGHPANWRDPALGINRSPDGFGGPFQNSANVLMADGSVRFLRNTIDPAVLQKLATPAGGETISPEDY